MSTPGAVISGLIASPSIRARLEKFQSESGFRSVAPTASADCADAGLVTTLIPGISS